MRLRLVFFLLLLLGSPAGNWASTLPPRAPTTARRDVHTPLEPFWEKRVVRVNSTVQSYQFRHPWAKYPPITRAGIGAILQDGNVIVTAQLVANHTYVEIENPQTGTRIPAKILRVDYNYNLALLHPETPLDHFTSCELDLTAKAGDSVSVLQQEPNGQISSTAGSLANVAVTLYPSEISYLLTFRISARLQDRDSNTTLPVVRDQKLTGLAMRADPKSQTYDVVPAQIIQQFVENPAPHAGVPHLGLTTTSTRDPQLRHWLQLPRSGGIYVCKVEENSPAAQAGLCRGDILYSVDHQSLDEQGDITDPHFGKINFSYLIGSQHRVGDELNLEIFRGGKFYEKKAKLDPTSVENNLSPAYVWDQQPGYFILGGLVFTELSRPYLQEWGPDWKIRAPQRLVYMDQYQTEVSQFHGKIVFLSEILPSDITMGFDDLSYLILTKVNGHPIHSLKDLAQAATQPIHGLQKIEFFEDPHLLYLDAAAAVKTDLKLIKDYSIPATTNVKITPPTK